MVIAWIFMSSTGILIARYYKFIFPNEKLFRLDLWFTVHRPLMMCVPMCSIAALILILADLEWQWVRTERPIQFAHSIFGIVAIALSIIQVHINQDRI